MPDLTVNLNSLDNKVKVGATARNNPEVVIDYFPPIGTGEGYTSLELLMISYGSCLATTILTVLRHKMQKTVYGISVEINGTVREEHPKTLTHMKVLLRMDAKDVTGQEMSQAVQAAEEGLCPVWAMIKGNVDIDIEFTFSG